MNIKNFMQKTRQLFKKPRIIALAVIIVLGGGYGVYKIIKNHQSSVTYKTAEVTKGTLTVTVSGTGNVEVSNRASVSPGISGEIYDLSVSTGDKVEKGQLLFKISNDQLDTNISTAYTSYLQAKQSYENSVSQLLQAQKEQSDVNNNPKSTDEEKNIANQQVNSAQLAVTVAEQKISATWKDYELTKDTAAKRMVRAPMDGTITILNVTNGDQLGSTSGNGSSGSSNTSGSSNSNSNSSTGSSSSSSSTSSSAAIVIDDLSSMQASVSINEVDASSVKAGQKASITFDAVDGLTLTGKVKQISAIGTETSGVVTYPATISFDSLDERIKPQMSLTATITTDVKQDVLMVPVSAVKTSGDVKYVLLMQSGKPVETTVEAGLSSDTYTEIKSGISEGDTIVTQTVTNSNKSSTSNSNNGSSLRNLTGGGMGSPPRQ